LKIIIDLPEDWEDEGSNLLWLAIREALDHRRGLPNNEYSSSEDLGSHMVADILLQLPDLPLVTSEGNVRWVGIDGDAVRLSFMRDL
jgi:hypothetical protein